MADLTITAANVASTSGVQETGIAGATITAGQVVYADSTTGRYLLADNNSATAAAKLPRGIALHAASSGQPMTILKSGTLTVGGTMTAGVAYYLSDTPGGICPVADLASGETSVLLGISSSTTVLKLSILASGVTL